MDRQAATLMNAGRDRRSAIRRKDPLTSVVSARPEGIVETGIGPATAVPRRVVTMIALLCGRSAPKAILGDLVTFVTSRQHNPNRHQSFRVSAQDDRGARRKTGVPSIVTP